MVCGILKPKPKCTLSGPTVGILHILAALNTKLKTALNMMFGPKILTTCGLRALGLATTDMLRNPMRTVATSFYHHFSREDQWHPRTLSPHHPAVFSMPASSKRPECLGSSPRISVEAGRWEAGQRRNGVHPHLQQIDPLAHQIDCVDLSGGIGGHSAETICKHVFLQRERRS